MAEKYLSFSPYVYVGNNPVNITDPNGMDWNITRRTDSLGNDHYDITVNGVLYNNSYSRNINMEKLLNAIINNVNNTFTFSGDGFSVSMNLNLRMVNSVDDIKATDHVFEVAGQGAFPEEGALGMVKNKSLHIRLSKEYIDGMISGRHARAFSHELGHTGRLPDENLEGALGVQSILTNLMTQSSYLQNKKSDYRQATKLERIQIEALYNNYTNGTINNNPAIRKVIKGINVQTVGSPFGPRFIPRFTYKNKLIN